MDTRTCVIKPRVSRKRVRVDTEPCPLCSTELIVKSALMTNLEAIEDSFLGRVSPDEIVRIQYEFYTKTYRQPLEDLQQSFVDLTEDHIRAHFSLHRVSKCKMLLDDVMWTHSTQQRMVDNFEDDHISSDSLKTWVQLSKHKHELLRALDGMRAKEPESLTTCYELNDM